MFPSATNSPRMIGTLPSVSLPTPASSTSTTTTFKAHSFSPSAQPQPPRYLKFRTTYWESLRYLKTIRVIDPNTKPHKLPLPDTVSHIISIVNFLKSKGFSDHQLARLASDCPKLFSSTHLDPTEIEPVFEFLITDLHASIEESCSLIVYCPEILFSDVEFCLQPTLDYLGKLGIGKLNVATNLNAHLLNTRVDKIDEKIRFLKSTGLSYEETARFCARLPAIFGYSIDNNLKPKLEYLVEEMERDVEELKEFPQYFGFSLKWRIAPRHMHLKQRNVHIKLNRMLLWSDRRFYTKWK